MRMLDKKRTMTYISEAFKTKVLEKEVEGA